MCCRSGQYLYNSIQFFFSFQYAVMHADGSPLYSKRRQVTIERITRSVSGFSRTNNEERLIVRDDGIVHYSFVADSDAQSIRVSAYYDTVSTGRSPQTNLQLYRIYSWSNNYLHIDTSTEKPIVSFVTGSSQNLLRCVKRM